MLLSNEQKNNIINYLKNNFRLPESGFVAGQAVASLVYKEIGIDINSPINDVDVFKLVDPNYKNRIKTRTMFSESTLRIEHGSGHNQTYSVGRRGYHVKLSTYLKEDENVNVVFIKQKHDKENVDKMFLLSSFDFNCCSVGFDIETETFYWTKQFEDFVRTKQLRVQSVHTPIHTLLRLNKKIKDLGSNVFCDKAVERDLLVFSIKMFNSNNYDIVVGDRFFKLYNAYYDDFINSLFTIEEHEDDKYNKLVFSKERIHNYIVTESPIDYKENNIFSNLEEAQGFSYSEKIWTQKIAGIQSVLSFHSHFTYQAYVHLYHVIKDTGVFSNDYSKNIIEEINFDDYDIKKDYIFQILKVSSITNKMTNSALSRINMNISFKENARLSKLFSKHPMLIEKITFDHYEHSAAELLNILYEIEGFVKKEKKKEFVYGLIELDFKTIFDIRKEIHKPFEELKETLLKLSKEDLLIAKEKQVLKKEKSIQNTFKLKQLVSMSDFYYAGQELNNCIFGYIFRYIKDDGQLFFRMEYKGNVSNLYLNTKSGYVSQHYGIKNSNVSKTEKLIGYFILTWFAQNKITALQMLLRNCYGIEFNKQNFKYKVKSKINRFKNKYWKKEDNKSKDFENIPMCFDDDIPF